jgi:hypothetical protein
MVGSGATLSDALAFGPVTASGTERSAVRSGSRDFTRGIRTASVAGLLFCSFAPEIAFAGSDKPVSTVSAPSKRQPGKAPSVERDPPELTTGSLAPITPAARAARALVGRRDRAYGNASWPTCTGC